MHEVFFPFLNKRISWVIITLLFISIIAAILKSAGIQLNITHSMPIGFYRATSSAIPHRGDIVAVCLPKAIAQEGLHQGYLTKGKCSSGAIPVVKEVIAVPHDTVELIREGFIVNGRFYQVPWHELDRVRPSDTLLMLTVTPTSTTIGYMDPMRPLSLRIPTILAALHKMILFISYNQTKFSYFHKSYL